MATLFVLSNKAPKFNVDRTLPMAVFEDKDKLWQVTTYDDVPITAMVIEVYPQYKQLYKKVYLNFRSQFVFADGSGVTLQGEPLFWNRAGDVVDYNYNTINESSIFYINGKGVKPHTAMTLKQLKTDIRRSVIKEKDKIRESEIEKVLGRG
jgi:hypothetical protein